MRWIVLACLLCVGCYRPVKQGVPACMWCERTPECELVDPWQPHPCPCYEVECSECGDSGTCTPIDGGTL